MVNVSEALDIVFSVLHKPLVKAVPIDKAVGCVIAEPIVADRDFPPFDRIAMDGIAVNLKAVNEGRTEYVIAQTQAAGEPRKKLHEYTHCLEVMTGAMLPEGTDAVVRYEDVSIANGTAKLSVTPTHYQHVHRKGQDAREAEELVAAGTLLSPAEIALLATVGKQQVNVFAYPTAAIVSSGDELVSIDKTPEAHQIRQSNVYALHAAMHAMGWSASRYHLPDYKELIATSLTKLLSKNDVVILSGGVSKGKFDFVPEVLASLGVQKLFHQVSQRPGKPFWFGSTPSGKVVFALPGNPVSTYMCFYKYIKPWVTKSLGLAVNDLHAVLADDVTFAPSLTYFLQVKAVHERGQLVAYPIAGGGSGDFANLKNVTGFLELEATRKDFKKGEVLPYIPFRDVL